MTTMTMRKLLAILLSVTMILMLMPSMAVSAADDGTSSDSHEEHSGWTAISTTTTISQNGSYYISETFIGSITVSENVTATLCLNGKEITCNSSSESVIEISAGASLTLEDCSADNTGTLQRSKDKEGFGGGVYVNSEATFTMNGGTISGCGASLFNNNQGAGGGVYVDSSASFNFNGGSITKCEAVNGGGGVYVYKSATFSMTGGSVSECTSKYDGGGVYLNKSTFNMSGGSIYKNEAGRNGGGIALEGSSESGSTFEMTGGEVYSNTAKNCGGGISMFNCSTATISKGSIYKNEAKREAFWAGGGVYVDEGCHLYLTNVAIYKNTADFIGGGIAACQTADTEIYINDGGIIYENTNSYNTSNETYKDYYESLGISTPSHEISLRRDTSGKITISSVFLGGGVYDWTNGSGETIDDMNTWLDGQTSNDNQTSKYISIDNTQSKNEAAVQLAMSLAKVLIYENTASNGGGIGVNGSLTIGTDSEMTSVTVTKSWAEPNEEHPDSVTVWLTNTVDGVTYKIQSAELNSENSWTYTFTNLPKNDKFSYSVVEEDLSGYTCEVTGNAENGFTITNTRTSEPNGDSSPSNVTVQKVWILDDGGTAAQSVTVNLYGNGVYVASATLSAANGWSYTWYGLDSTILWLVEEASVPIGFTSSVTRNGNVFIITNDDIDSGASDVEIPEPVEAKLCGSLEDVF